MDDSDSPSFPRKLDAALPTAGSTSSLVAAVICSLARESPLAQFRASSATTYWLPSAAIDPLSMALMFSRSQISRATLPVTRSSAARPINWSALRIVLSGTMFRYGDCSSCTASACFRVPSNTGSPVVFTKSARRMESFSVSFWVERDRQYNPPPNKAAITTTAAAITANRAGADVPVCPGSCGEDLPGASIEGAPAREEADAVEEAVATADR